MQIRAIVMDFHGTLVEGTQAPAPELLAELGRLRADGVKLILNTSCDLEFLLKSVTREQLNVFDAVILETGSVVLWPGAGMPELLAPPRSLELLGEMRRLKIPLEDFWSGECLVATRRPYAAIARQALANVEALRRDAGLEPLSLQEQIDGATVTYTPQNVDKATAMAIVVRDRMGIPLRAVAGVGDGRRDLGFLRCCGVVIALANADPSIRLLPRAFRTRGTAGAGTLEGLQALQPRLRYMLPAAPRFL